MDPLDTPFVRLDEQCEYPATLTLPPDETPTPGYLRFYPFSRLTFTFVESSHTALHHLTSSNPLDTNELRGELLSGKHCLLRGCAFLSHNVNATTLRAHSLVLSDEPIDADATRFTQLRVQLDGLEQWLGAGPIQIDSSQTTSNSGAASPDILRAEPREPITLSGGCDSFEVRIKQPVRPAWQNRGFTGSLACDPYVYIRPDAGMLLTDIWHYLSRLQGFFSLIFGTPAFLLKLELARESESAGTSSHDVVRFIAPVPVGGGETQAGHDRPLLPHRDACDSLSALWATWIRDYDKYDLATQLLFADDMRPGHLLEFRFLAVMQALEVLHRRSFCGLYTTQDEYNSVTSRLIRCLPTELSADHKMALESRIRYGNEFSLRRRMKEIVNALPSSLREKFSFDLKKFAYRAVDTRNHLTHYSTDSSSDVFSENELLFAERSLSWLARSFILVRLGAPSDLLADALGNSQDFCEWRDRVRKIC